MNPPLLRWLPVRVLADLPWTPCRRFLFWSLACLVFPAIPLATAQEPPAASAGGVGVEDLAARFRDTAAPVAKKAKELIALVNAETSAKRISEPLAQGLRWTLGNFSFSAGGGDVLALLASTRMPLEDAAIMEGARSLEASERSAEVQRAALKTQGIAEAEKRSAELVRNARNVGEIDAFLADVEKFQKFTEQHLYDSASPGSTGDFSGCITLMRSLRDVVALSASADFSTLDSVVSRFKSDALAAPDFAPPAAYSKREAGILALFQQAADSARDDLGSALIEGKSSERISKLAGDFMDAMSRFSGVARILVPDFLNSGFHDCQATKDAYSAIEGVSLSIASRQWSKAGVEIFNARQSILRMPATQAVALEALLTKLERQVSDAAETPSREFHEQLHAKLSGVKGPSDLAAIAMDLSKGTSGWPGGEDSWVIQGLARELSALAAAWSGEDLNLLAGGNFRGGNVEDADLAAMRRRIGREIVSESADAPELNQAPFANQPLAEGVDRLVGKLAGRGKWRQALRLLETQSVLEGRHGDDPDGPNAISAVRSYLTGISLEEAGLWREAAAAYKAVLASAMDNTPVAEAAARLKVLAKERPEALKTGA